MRHRRAQLTSSRSTGRARSAGESRRTVLIALASNGVIAVAKLIGGVMSGSSALLAEAAHSVADTTNEIFLLVSISQSQRDPDPAQPFGYGQERFLWSFVAAVGMFLAGAIFAVGYGTYELIAGSKEDGGYTVAWIVLAIGAVSEGVSWARALKQTRGEAQEGGKSLLEHVRTTRDPNSKMVLLEDSAALLGIAIAAFGIGMHELTGAAAWDRGASIAIGLMLIVVALRLAHDSKALLVGASARPEERATIEQTIESFDEVAEVLELLTMVLGPNALLVAARIDLTDHLDSSKIERVSNEIEDALHEAVPDVTEVFLDATPGRRARAGTAA